jgi:tetratricopeptide (TPR) repeat protein
MALSINPKYQLAKNNLQLSISHKHSDGDLIIAKTYTPEEYLTQSLNYYNQRQYELCIAACVSALVINPKYDLAYNNLCSAYIKLGKWDDAILVGEKGLKINPDFERLKNNVEQAVEGKKNAGKK